jgi:HAD superfamily hydrolase (TIGR01509 family)
VAHIRGIIFDIDGTLVDSNDAHAHAWQQAMAQYGYEVPFADIRPLIGMGGDKVLPELLGIQKESETGARIEQSRSQLFKERYLPHLRAFPGAMALLRHLHKQGFTLAVATSSKPDEMSSLLNVVDPHAVDLFGQEVSSKEATQSKPDPDVIQVALKRTGCEPGQALMIGDTAYDIQSASGAGIKTIALRCGGWSDHDLQGALAIYNDPADLLAHYATSPLVEQEDQ